MNIYTHIYPTLVCRYITIITSHKYYTMIQRTYCHGKWLNVVEIVCLCVSALAKEAAEPRAATQSWERSVGNIAKMHPKWYPKASASSFSGVNIRPAKNMYFIGSLHFLNIFRTCVFLVGYKSDRISLKLLKLHWKNPPRRRRLCLFSQWTVQTVSLSLLFLIYTENIVQISIPLTRCFLCPCTKFKFLIFLQTFLCFCDFQKMNLALSQCRLPLAAPHAWPESLFKYSLST